jgi:adenylate cyclase
MKNRWLNSFTVAVFATSLSLFIYFLEVDFIALLELKAYDLKVTARGERPVSDQVVIVAIDEKSLKKEGRWPWPRSRLARLIDSLTRSEVSAIGVDILFPEKDIYILSLIHILTLPTIYSV